ncbi:MAG: ribonuclease H-like domain-containing protein [Treponema sp.]|jgi:uncharacterized protein YprB with RNaseH-like and TPR domain|nr:ribonuclease H-like domain-containing protein [Treponema sp.]
MDLRSRLSRIRKIPLPGPASAPEAGPFEKLGWIPSGPASSSPLILSRTQTLELSMPIPQTLPQALEALSPGGAEGRPESLRFFDLETTGLSIGAGTIAFLAAVGVPEGTGGPEGYAGIRITQYLLLDYPGEGDFLETLAGEFGGASPPPTLVSYNGKSFDAQILRNRCLMHGIAFPALDHLDLLHSARRLWKGVLPNCSQATVETAILSLSREGDLSGAFAPESWFDFLRSGDSRRLLQICDHNSRDIVGLASLFACLCRIAADPLGAGERYSADMEQLAVCWQRALGRRLQGEEEFRRARALLERGAALGYPRCCRKLAIEAEWRQGNIAAALALVDRALARNNPSRGLPEWLRLDLEARRQRLLGKAGARRTEGTP